MSSYHSFQRQSRKIALCGLMTALAVVILSLGGLIPLTAIAFPMLAMLCLIPAVCDYGPKTAMVQFAATAVLGLLLCADQEASLLYLFLGWYPALRPALEKLPRWAGMAVKAGIYCGAMCAMYSVILFLFQMEAVVEEFASYSAAMIVLLLALGCFTFLVFDRALGMLASAYRRRRKA